MTCIVNLISASPKRHTKLRSAQAIEIERGITSGERETSKGANQMGTLHRAGTRDENIRYIRRYISDIFDIGDVRHDIDDDRYIADILVLD